MLNFKRLISLCTAFLMVVALMPSALAFDVRSSPLGEMSVKSSLSYPLENGEARLINSHNCVVLYVDTPAQLERQNSLDATDEELEERQCIANIFVPYDPAVNDALYADMKNNMSTVLQSAQSGYNEIHGNDRYDCAEFRVGVYYTKELKDDGFTYYDLTRVKGGYENPGTSGDYVGENVYVTHQYIDVGQVGTSYDGEKCLNQNLYDYQLRANDRDWSYTPPSNWKAVCGDEQMCAVGATYHFTLARGASSWSDQIVVSALT